MTTTAAPSPVPSVSERLRPSTLRSDLLLLGPAGVLFLLILVVPLALLLLTSLNPSARGVVGLSSTFTLENYERLLTAGLYLDALVRSMFFGGVTALLSVVLGYPIAFLMANATSLRLVTTLTILLLVPFQLDVVVRVLGLVVMLGDNGLINRFLQDVGLTQGPLPLMYNDFGVIVGTTEFMLPFGVFAMVGALRTIDPELMLAARSLGMPYWAAFRKVILPLSLPGIVAAALVSFTLTVSNFIVPVLMSSYRAVVLPALMSEQVTVVANFRFAAAMGVALLVISFITVAVAFQLVRRVLQTI